MFWRPSLCHQYLPVAPLLGTYSNASRHGQDWTSTISIITVISWSFCYCAHMRW